MAYDFPPDLIEASRTCETLREQLEALPLDAVTRADGTPIERKRPTKEYTDEEREEVAKLREQRLAAATVALCHRFWSEVPKEELLKARSALKQLVRAA